jgi:hypothetical protein
MARINLLEQETQLVETMLSALDARESARAAGSPMLIYLADMLAQHCRDELKQVRRQSTSVGIPG